MATINGNNFNNVLNGVVDPLFPFFLDQPDTFNGFDGNDTINALGTNDILNGGAGNDTLNGGAGNDTLNGDDGDDTLNGGTGADNMNGGFGNDTYVVDNIGDVAAEVAGGIDLVQSSVSHTLSTNLENLTLTGTAAINGTGNAKNNILIGNSANNVLNGGTGADNMNGGDGNDTYFVDNVGDIVKESFDDALGGTADTVFSSVSYSLAPGTPGNQGHGIENLTLTGFANINATGNAKNNVLTGNSGNNTLTGSAGNDTLIGGAGNDTLTGGSGADFFQFQFLSEGIDVITDFSFQQGDKIQISAAGFGAISLNQVSYNSVTGGLFYDPTGLVGPTQFATLANPPAGFSVNLDVVII